MCYVGFFVHASWGRIVSVSEGVSGKKSVLLLNALPCANKNMVFGGGACCFVSSWVFAHAFCLGGGIVSVSTDVSGKRSVWFLRWARSNSGKKSGRLLNERRENCILLHSAFSFASASVRFDKIISCHWSKVTLKLVPSCTLHVGIPLQFVLGWDRLTCSRKLIFVLLFASLPVWPYGCQSRGTR